MDDFTSENISPEDIPNSTAHTELIIKPLENSNPERKKPARKIKYPKMTFYINETQYPVVKAVGKKIFKWKLTKEIEDDWDICWTDMAVQPETLSRMK